MERLVLGIRSCWAAGVMQQLQCQDHFCATSPKRTAASVSQSPPRVAWAGCLLPANLSFSTHGRVSSSGSTDVLSQLIPCCRSFSCVSQDVWCTPGFYSSVHQWHLQTLTNVPGGQTHPWLRATGLQRDMSSAGLTRLLRSEWNNT